VPEEDNKKIKESQEAFEKQVAEIKQKIEKEDPIEELQAKNKELKNTVDGLVEKHKHKSAEFQQLLAKKAAEGDEMQKTVKENMQKQLTDLLKGSETLQKDNIALMETELQLKEKIKALDSQSNQMDDSVRDANKYMDKFKNDIIKVR